MGRCCASATVAQLSDKSTASVELDVRCLVNVNTATASSQVVVGRVGADSDAGRRAGSGHEPGEEAAGERITSTDGIHQLTAV